MKPFINRILRNNKKVVTLSTEKEINPMQNKPKSEHKIKRRDVFIKINKNNIVEFATIDKPDKKEKNIQTCCLAKAVSLGDIIFIFLD